MSLMPGGGVNGMLSPPLPEEMFAAAQQAAAEEENMRTMEWVKMVVGDRGPGMILLLYARLELAASSGTP